MIQRQQEYFRHIYITHRRKYNLLRPLEYDVALVVCVDVRKDVAVVAPVDMRADPRPFLDDLEESQ